MSKGTEQITQLNESPSASPSSTSQTDSTESSRILSLLGQLLDRLAALEESRIIAAPTTEERSGSGSTSTTSPGSVSTASPESASTAPPEGANLPGPTPNPPGNFAEQGYHHSPQRQLDQTYSAEMELQSRKMLLKELLSTQRLSEMRRRSSSNGLHSMNPSVNGYKHIDSIGNTPKRYGFRSHPLLFTRHVGSASNVHTSPKEELDTGYHRIRITPHRSQEGNELYLRTEFPNGEVRISSVHTSPKKELDTGYHRIRITPHRSQEGNELYLRTEFPNGEVRISSAHTSPKEELDTGYHRIRITPHRSQEGNELYLRTEFPNGEVRISSVHTSPKKELDTGYHRIRITPHRSQEGNELYLRTEFPNGEVRISSSRQLHRNRDSQEWVRLNSETTIPGESHRYHTKVNPREVSNDHRLQLSPREILSERLHGTYSSDSRRDPGHHPSDSKIREGRSALEHRRYRDRLSSRSDPSRLMGTTRNEDQGQILPGHMLWNTSRTRSLSNHIFSSNRHATKSQRSYGHLPRRVLPDLTGSRIKRIPPTTYPAHSTGGSSELGQIRRSKQTSYFLGSTYKPRRLDHLRSLRQEGKVCRSNVFEKSSVLSRNLQMGINDSQGRESQNSKSSVNDQILTKGTSSVCYNTSRTPARSAMVARSLEKRFAPAKYTSTSSPGLHVLDRCIIHRDGSLQSFGRMGYPGSEGSKELACQRSGTPGSNLASVHSEVTLKQPQNRMILKEIKKLLRDSERFMDSSKSRKSRKETTTWAIQCGVNGNLVAKLNHWKSTKQVMTYLSTENANRARLATRVAAAGSSNFSSLNDSLELLQNKSEAQEVKRYTPSPIERISSPSSVVGSNEVVFIEWNPGKIHPSKEQERILEGRLNLISENARMFMATRFGKPAEKKLMLAKMAYLIGASLKESLFAKLLAHLFPKTEMLDLIGGYGSQRKTRKELGTDVSHQILDKWRKESRIRPAKHMVSNGLVKNGELMMFELTSPSPPDLHPQDIGGKEGESEGSVASA
eukprot:TRINITY_DN274_c0_g1_i19.p1 TRINITY_DN274_c0_g1~~TRINITY_DN274_c0_g1_i19.p1  ORF type:complete len:1014 (-),score=101.53 TRINITY_DN274_c0_g1_i19:314-3355(-)